MMPPGTIRLSLFALVFLSLRAFAGPPFQTDDPEPVELHHYEAYVFGTWDHSPTGTGAAIPAFEFNVGAAPNLQLHAVVPLAYDAEAGSPAQYGPGDIELGAKYRFFDQSKHGWRPMVGIFPMLEVPSGDAARGLGNGSTWARLPLWVQKDIGSWTTYGGVGYEINRAPGMQDSAFGGWLLQKQVTPHWVLGGEAFSQAAGEVGGRGSTFLDGGGYYYFKPNDPGVQLLFMAGHTVAGEAHFVGYLGLYWTWGKRQ